MKKDNIIEFEKNEVVVLRSLVGTWEDYHDNYFKISNIKTRIEEEKIEVIKDSLQKEVLRIENDLEKLAVSLEEILESDVFYEDKYLKQLKILTLDIIAKNRSNNLYLDSYKVLGFGRKYDTEYIDINEVKTLVDILPLMYFSEIEQVQKEKGVA